MEDIEQNQPVSLNPFQQFVADILQARGGEHRGFGAVALATSKGLERTFIRDIVEGRKATVRAGRNLSLLADALGVNQMLLLDLMAQKPAAIHEAEKVLEHYRGDIAESHDFARVPIEQWDPVQSDPGPDDSVGYSIEHYRARVRGALPEIDVHVGAGQGNVGDMVAIPTGHETISGHKVVAEWLFPEGFLRNEAKVSPSHTLVMPVVGDSMIPTYMPGDRVLVDLLQNRMTADTVYVISDGMSDPQIKRLQRVMFSDPPQVRIISDNPALETDTVDLDRVHIIGRVCGHIARK